MDEFVLSIQELNNYVSNKLSSDPFLSEIWVQGEVCDVSNRQNTAYFVLADEAASVDCISFSYDNSANVSLIKEGKSVILCGDISLYRKTGKFRIVVSKIKETGIGERFVRIKELQEKLAKQGVFDQANKKAIPKYPKKIGIVTSKDGAAIQDIMQIVRRRNPLVELVLYPVKVQGQDAPKDIVTGINYFNQNYSDIDVLIVGRGGGSAEDLFAFDDEEVVLCAYRSLIPIISAVGHESDFSLLDLVADLRAPTPSAAAELAVPLRQDILIAIQEYKEKMATSIKNRVYSANMQLSMAKKSMTDRGILLKISKAQEVISKHRRMADVKINLLYQKTASQIKIYKTAITALNPAGTLNRGFAIVKKDDKIIRKTKDLIAGDVINITFADGTKDAKIL